MLEAEVKVEVQSRSAVLAAGSELDDPGGEEPSH